MSDYSITISSPLGSLILVADNQALLELEFVRSEPKNRGRTNSILESARKQLEEYFARKREQFDLPLNPRGTEYQKKIWKELLNIPYGATTTYGELGKRTNSVARAVGSANGSNPIAIVIPCHRVIGANGKLIGYGGGLDKKIWLIRHESGVLV